MNKTGMNADAFAAQNNSADDRSANGGKESWMEDRS